MRVQMIAGAGGATSDAALTLRRYSTSILNKTVQMGGVSSPFRERLGSQRLPDRPRLRVEPVLGNSIGKGILERTISQTGELDDAYDDSVIEPKLKANATLVEIVERMRHPTLGVGFLQQTVSLPSHAFVSIYAIHWLQANMEGMTYAKATEIMERLLQEKMICHASGDTRKRFVVGYYMYHILPQKKDKDVTEYVKPLGDLQSFENEWMEVQVLGPRSPLLPADPAGSLSIPAANTSSTSPAPSPSPSDITVPAFLCDDIDFNYIKGDGEWPLYKNTHLDIDVNNKSDRIEWGHARYQATFRPDQAYEMCIQWAVASGNIVAELVFGWARKAQHCRLQMVPIPADPLALPFSLKSDPLRGPIYIPLNVHPLTHNDAPLFQDFPEETWPERLFLFQEAIIGRFGFIKCTAESASASPEHAYPSLDVGLGDHLYVHVTGNIFILIPTTLKAEHKRNENVSKPVNSKRYPVHPEVAPSPEGYITRHVSGKNKDDYDNSRRMGFLWSWNHMISKKWKYSQTPATGDEVFQNRMLRDFKHFCANNEQRLSQFWDQCWELREKACGLKTV